MLSNADLSRQPCGSPCVISFFCERQLWGPLPSSYLLNISSRLIIFLRSLRGGNFLSAFWKFRQMVSNRSVLLTCFIDSVRGLWQISEARLPFTKAVLTLLHCTIFILMSTKYSIVYYCFFWFNQYRFLVQSIEDLPLSLAWKLVSG